MPKNEIFKETFENTYDKEKNYNSICSKIKGGINMKKKILNIAAVLLIVGVIGITAKGVQARIAWNIAYKEYENRNVITKGVAIDESEQNEASENLNMDYVYQDDIGIKLNSLLLSNDYCQINLDIKIDKDIPEDKKDEIYYGYAVYDENNNIYNVSERLESKNQTLYWKKLYKELGIKTKYMDSMLANSASIGISRIQLMSDKGFPKSKKLYIRIFDIGYTKFDFDEEKEKVKDRRDFCLSDSEWQFEIEVPEKFYTRTVVELGLSREIEGIKINKAELTQTGLVMKVEINQLRDFIMDGKDMNTQTFTKSIDSAFYISDGDGNKYIANQLGTTHNPNEISARFGIGKDALDKKIFLNVSLNHIQEKIELIQE